MIYPMSSANGGALTVASHAATRLNEVWNSPPPNPLMAGFAQEPPPNLAIQTQQQQQRFLQQQQQQAHFAQNAPATTTTRRYSSSGTAAATTTGAPPVMALNCVGGSHPQPQQQQSALNNNRRPSQNRGIYRSGTFNTNVSGYPAAGAPHNRAMPRGASGQLRTSSSFHGSIQPSGTPTSGGPYNGRASYGTHNHHNHQNCINQQPPKGSLYAVTGSFHAGMKDVPAWLKTLRLHKYTRMFQELTYEEMMALNDQKLEQRQVTKGARKKILQNLDKLRDRSSLIRQLERCIDDHGDVRCLIVEVRAMMDTPIAAYTPKDEYPKMANYMIDAIGIPACEVADENLPGHITRLCIRLHEYLFRSGVPQIQELGLEEDYLYKLLQIYDKALANEAFTYRQKYCINECRRGLARYMHDQMSNAAVGTPLVYPTTPQHHPMPSTLPTLVSSPSSSSYHTMSPPTTTSTRRNSDSARELEEITGAAAATNINSSSEEDFIVRSAGSVSPPGATLLSNAILGGFFSSAQQRPQVQQQQQQQSGLNGWSLGQQQAPLSQQTCKRTAQPPPGFEWSATASVGLQQQQQNRPSAPATTTKNGSALNGSNSVYSPYVASTSADSARMQSIIMTQQANSASESAWFSPLPPAVAQNQATDGSDTTTSSLPSGCFGGSSAALLGTTSALQQQQRPMNPSGPWEQRSDGGAGGEKNPLAALADSNPTLYGYLLHQIQQQQHQQRQQLAAMTSAAVAKMPPKTPSPIGTRPTNYSTTRMPAAQSAKPEHNHHLQQQQSTPAEETLMPLTVSEKLRFIAENTDGQEILDVAVQLAMNRLRLQKQREAAMNANGADSATSNGTSVLWQNAKEQAKRPTVPAAQQQYAPRETPASQHLNWWWRHQQQQQQQQQRQPQQPKQDAMLGQPKSQNVNNHFDIDQFLMMQTSLSAKSTADAYDPWASSEDSLTGRSTLDSPPAHNNLLQATVSSAINTDSLFGKLNGQQQSDVVTNGGKPAARDPFATNTGHHLHSTNGPSDFTAGSSSASTPNLLGRMLSDTINGTGNTNSGCQQKSHQHEWIMRQYAYVDDDLPSINTERLFAGLSEAATTNSQRQREEQQLFAAFRPLACPASGATVH